MKRVLFESQTAPSDSNIGSSQVRYDDMEDEQNEHYVSYEMIKSAALKTKNKKTRRK